MSRRLMTISAVVLVLAAFAAAQAAPANLAACSSASDCASATCCGISVCVNRQFAPSENACTSVPCPAETVGPVTSCECTQNVCKTVKDSIIVVVPVTNAPGVPNPPAPTFNEPADTLLACSADSDCGMQTCCESNLCIARAFAPDCSNVTSRFCPAMQLNCQCQSNRCARRPTAAPPTTSSPATVVVGTTTSAPDDAEANTDSGASTVPVIASIATALAACLVVYHL